MPKQRDWWCRLYSEVVDDDKLTWVADTTNERRVVILGVWSGLIALANRSPERGTLLVGDGIPYTIPMLARKLDIEATVLTNILNAMCSIGLLCGTPFRVANFDKRNPVSDDATTRKQDQRARGTSPAGVTGLSRDKVVTPADVVTPGSISTSTIALSISSGEGESEGEGIGAPVKVEPPAEVEAQMEIDPAAYDRVVKAYEANIGLITTFVAEDIQEALVRFPEDWCVDAMREAVRASVRKWSYVQAILNRWGIDGRVPPNGDNGNGHSTAPPGPVAPWAAAGMEREPFVAEYGQEAQEACERWDREMAQQPGTTRNAGISSPRQSRRGGERMRPAAAASSRTG